MSPGSKREYVEAIFLRHKKASRKEKTTILDKFCTLCGYHRKHAIMLLHGFRCFTRPKGKKPGRHSLYDTPAILNPLKTIWVAANLPSSKRLKAILSPWLPGYSSQFGTLSPGTTTALVRISPATIDRVLKSIRVSYRKRGRATTKPGTLLRKHIPINTTRWDETRLGFPEADTVAHCGASTAGMYAFTIDCANIATGWTEQRAIWDKG